LDYVGLCFNPSFFASLIVFIQTTLFLTENLTTLTTLTTKVSDLLFYDLVSYPFVVTLRHKLLRIKRIKYLTWSFMLWLSAVNSYLVYDINDISLIALFIKALVKPFCRLCRNMS